MRELIPKRKSKDVILKEQVEYFENGMLPYKLTETSIYTIPKR
jgi:hypothetical protein